MSEEIPEKPQEPLEKPKPTEPMVGLGDALAGAPRSPQDLTEPSDPGHGIPQLFNEAYPNVQLTKDQALTVRRFITNLRLGGSCSVSLICTGDNCEFKTACPLWQAGAAPVQQPCPLELSVIMSMREQLSSMVDLESNNPVVRNHISEICQIAAMEWRCQMKLAYDFHDVIQMVPAAITPAGDVHTKPEMSPIILLMNELSQRRSRLLRELTSTPEAKWRKAAALGQKEEDSLSRKMAAHRRTIQEVQGILPDVIAPPEHVKLLSVGDPDAKSQVQQKS